MSIVISNPLDSFAFSFQFVIETLAYLIHFFVPVDQLQEYSFWS